MNTNTNSPKVGISHLEKLVVIIISLVNQGVVSFKDGFQALDLLSFLDELKAIPEALKSMKDVVTELLDVDSEERVKLEALVQEQLQIPNEAVKELVQAALDATIANIRLIEAAKAVKDGQAQKNETAKAVEEDGTNASANTNV